MFFFRLLKPAEHFKTDGKPPSQVQRKSGSRAQACGLGQAASEFVQYWAKKRKNPASIKIEAGR
jgi:hypothetical protein